jgi:hypothetical protein
MMSPRLAWMMPLVLSSACGDAGGASAGDSATATSVTTASATDTPAPTTSGAGTEGGAGSSGGDSSSGGAPKLDVGFDSEGSGQPPVECPNVDILFVIDSSGSMADQQDSLIASFDGFVTGIQQQLTYTDSYHVGVVTSSDYFANAGGCTAIGDLIVQTGGPESSGASCLPFASGGHYLDEGEPDLAGKFACAAKVGTGGSDDEAMARGMLNALRPENNAPGACNAGFARADALTVIVLITDEDDVPEPFGCDPDDPFDNPCDTVGSGGTPDDWTAELLAYKGGIAENVVVLALLGQRLDNTCGAVPASKLIGFANDWGDHGFTGDVCATSYDEFFAAALPVVDEACAGYVPPAG